MHRPILISEGSQPISRILSAMLRDHFSRNPIARILKRPTRSVLIEPSDSHCLLGLAPNGACLANAVANVAVSSCLAFSPLPVSGERTIGG